MKHALHCQGSTGVCTILTNYTDPIWKTNVLFKGIELRQIYQYIAT